MGYLPENGESGRESGFEPLKDCPFCGSKAVGPEAKANWGWVSLDEAPSYADFYRVTYSSCDAARVARDKPERAIAKWNTRAVQADG